MGIALALLFVAIVVVWWLLSDRRSLSARLCREFQLDPKVYRLLATDLAGSNEKLFLTGDGLVGVADAVFRSKHEIVIGEAKSAKVKSGVRTRDLYQITLYMGVAKKKYRKDIRGILRYGNGRCVDVQFDEVLYNELLTHRAKVASLLASF